MTLVVNLDAAPVNTIKGSGPRNVESVASFLRAANATQYTAGDVISHAGAAAVLEFPLCGRIPGGGGKILRAHAHVDVNHATPPDLELYLFHEEPTNFSDNAALALVDADLIKIHAEYSMNGSNAKVVNAAASPAGALYYITGSSANQHGFVCAPDTASLFGLLVTRTTFTPITGSAWGVHLEIVQD